MGTQAGRPRLACVRVSALVVAIAAAALGMFQSARGSRRRALLPTSATRGVSDPSPAGSADHRPCRRSVPLSSRRPRSPACVHDDVAHLGARERHDLHEHGLGRRHGRHR